MATTIQKRQENAEGPLTTTSPAPSKPQSPQGQLLSLLEKSKNQIAMALPRHLTPDRMIRVAMTAFSRTPQLQECSVVSILGCVIQASELGLELTGPLGQAYMVPRWNKNTRCKEANFQVGYRGLMDLAYRSGRVSSFAAHCVHELDQFDFALGTKPYLRHKPAMKGDRGEVTAVYAVLTMKDGGSDFEVMSMDEIEAHRKKYADDSSFSPWRTAREEMAKKTVIRKLAKRAPMCVEMQKAAVVDEYADVGIAGGGMTFDADFKAIGAAEQAKQLLGMTPQAEAVEDPKPESDTDAMQRQDMIDYLNSQAAILTHPDDLARLKDELDAQRSLVGDVVYEAVRKTILGKVKK